MTLSFVLVCFFAFSSCTSAQFVSNSAPSPSAFTSLVSPQVNSQPSTFTDAVSNFIPRGERRVNDNNAFPQANSFSSSRGTNNERATPIVTNNNYYYRESPLRTVPYRSQLIPVQPVVVARPLVASAPVVAAPPPPPPQQQPGPVYTPRRTRSRARRPVPATPLSADPELSPCQQVKESGPCFEVLFKWAYNPASGQCHEFIYGGCGGTANRFEDAQKCMSVCGTNEYKSLPLARLDLSQ